MNTDEILRLNDLWQRLKNTDKPIVLYGQGDGADKIINECERHGIIISGVFASDDFVRHQQFRGFTVKSYDELCEQLGDMLVLVAFGTQRKDVLCNIKRIAAKSETYAPDVAVIGGGLFDKSYFAAHLSEISAIYERLADSRSKRTFYDIICYKITGDIKYLFDCECIDEPIRFCDDEIFLDLGAYTGDTVGEFVQKTGGKYGKIIAVEPDVKNFAKLVKNTEDLHDITHINKAVSDRREQICFAMKSGRNSVRSQGGRVLEADSVDNMLWKASGGKCTYIKMDVEGQEGAAIAGAANTIAAYQPKMKIAAYHRFDDIIQIPLAVFEQYDGYSLYLRHKPYVPAWDTDYYFVK